MIFFEDCDYFNDEQDNESAPITECESCYRYEICKNSINNSADKGDSNGY